MSGSVYTSTNPTILLIPRLFALHIREVTLVTKSCRVAQRLGNYHVSFMGRQCSPIVIKQWSRSGKALFGDKNLRNIGTTVL